MFGYPQSAISFLTLRWNFLSFSLWPSPTIFLSEGSGSIPSKTIHRHWRAVRCPCNCLFPRLNKPWSIRLTFARPNNLGGPPWNSPQFITDCPVLGSQTRLHHPGCRLVITEKSDINNFPLSAVSIPAATVQDAVSLHHCQGATLDQI